MFLKSNSISGSYQVTSICLTAWDLLQVTGGGGYTKENVARCWALETGVLLDTELPNGMMSRLLFLCDAFALLLCLFL